MHIHYLKSNYANFDSNDALIINTRS